ncbi:MAG: glycosyltransferase [Myxococcota bacterium]|nr:glycosyltransferase [Myxococcota bacterium]
MTTDRAVILLAGTRGETPSGGVDAALGSLLAAAEAAGLECQRIATHRGGGPWGKLGPWLTARASLADRIEALRRRGRVPVLYAHAGAWPSLVRKARLLAAARAAGAHTMLHLHGVEIDGYLDRSLGRRGMRWALAPADDVVVLSSWWRERLADALPGIAPSVLPNALPAAAEAEARRGPPRGVATMGELSVLTMTRLVRGKGVGAAIEAVAGGGAGMRLVVAGDGPRRASLQRLAERAGAADRVRFVGWVDGEAKRALLRQADVFCLPGQRDALPMSVLEALAHGLPVVADRGRAMGELVPDGRAGVLVDGRDSGAVRDALRTLEDVETRQRLGRGARAHALEIYGQESIGRQLRTMVARRLAAVDRP